MYLNHNENHPSFLGVLPWGRFVILKLSSLLSIRYKYQMSLPSHLKKPVLLPCGCYNRLLQTCCLKQQKLSSHDTGGPKSQNSVTGLKSRCGRAALLLEALEANLFLAFFSLWWFSLSIGLCCQDPLFFKANISKSLCSSSHCLFCVSQISFASLL